MEINEIETMVKELLPGVYAAETTVFYSELAHKLRIRMSHLILLGIFPDESRFKIHVSQNTFGTERAKDLAEWLPWAAMLCNWLNANIRSLEDSIS